MNWGYIYFVDKAEADKYMQENPKAYVEELQKLKMTHWRDGRK